MNFAENYGFTVQDESQGYHWNDDSCTLQPVVVYYKKDKKSCSKLFCFISDDLVRDVAFVWKVQFQFLDSTKIVKTFTIYVIISKILE
jgi:hypothetical protein